MAGITSVDLFANTIETESSAQVQAIAAAATLLINGSTVRVTLAGSTYTVTLPTTNVPSASTGNTNPVLWLIVIVEANTASGTVTFGGANLVTGNVAPTLATTVTGKFLFVWDSAISKWVF